jgi:uncharacterized Zn finger protein
MPAKRKPAVRDDIEYDDDYAPRRRFSDDGDAPWWAGRKDEESRVQRELEKRRAAGESLRAEAPSHARNLSSTFWGQAWNRNLMAYSDYENRMPRGRSYFRAGRVMNLVIARGTVTATVAGTSIYDVNITISPLTAVAWKRLKQRCQGQIGGLMELLSGSLSEAVMREVTDADHGLFPAPRGMKLSCSCPDYVGLCKHLAATLYAVGSRLDTSPALLFTLRGVDPQEMIATNAAEAVAHLTAAAKVDDARADALAGADLEAMFGIETAPEPAPLSVRKKKSRGT